MSLRSAPHHLGREYITLRTREFVASKNRNGSRSHGFPTLAKLSASLYKGPMKLGPVPGYLHVDHVGLTVPDLDPAVAFYCDLTGATELFRMGPFDARELPGAPDGRDWTEAHVNVPGARLQFAMLQVSPALKLELFQYDRPLDRDTEPPRNCDAGGHHLALKVKDIEQAVDYLRQRSDVRLMAGPIVISEGPCAGMRVIYFLDPWGNQLELTEFNL
jgi:catechol 2,3-dioxygenase-like lactoylglutathione lyase family enzyme